MTRMEETLSRVKAAVAASLGLYQIEVMKGSRLREDLHADSMDEIEIIRAVEEDFGIEIPDEDAEQIETVGDLASLVYLMTSGRSCE